MIDLIVKAEFESKGPPFIAKVRVFDAPAAPIPSEFEAFAWKNQDNGATYECRSYRGDFRLSVGSDQCIDGDVLLCMPSRGIAQRIIRRSSRHNTILLTERCDQLCVMCSQPPKSSDDEWRFLLYEQAIGLAEPNAVIGISGGEPTLYKEALLAMIGRAAEKRSDLSFHILSNGQHFTNADRSLLSGLHGRIRLVWGIPLYSHTEEVHDQTVGKSGAFRTLMENLFTLGSTRALIELRTVILATNALDLPYLADFISKTIPFVSEWAIMGMEPIGYAQANWSRLFFDHSSFSRPIANAIEIASLRNLRCKLYNVPRCTIPDRYRNFCVDSISDWKKKFLPACGPCAEKARCCGFFEWYNSASAWSEIKPIERGGLDHGETSRLYHS